ncbi:MAG: DUF883 family protein [Rubellimicrobium sp.]|nr:DUF883 family protein [Rubellimicrobium sp.]
MAKSDQDDPASQPEAALAEVLAELRAMRLELDALRDSMPSKGEADDPRSARDRVRQAAGDLADDLAEKGQRKLDAAEAELRDRIERTALFITRQPGTAMGVAAGLGFVLGLIMRR